VFNPCAFRNILFSLSCAMLLVVSMLGGASPAAAQGCQAALASPTEAVPLTNTTPTNPPPSKAKRVDEWDGDVLLIFTPLPGVIEIEGIGDGAESSLYTYGGTGSHPLVDSAYVGTGQGELQAILPAGYHCIEVAPGPGADDEDEIEIAASFTDACHLGDPDDHGDSFLCATPIDVDDTASGEISASSDHDVFTFTLTSTATLAIESTGATDVAASLYDDQGVLLEADDNDGPNDGVNFQIVRSLSAGRYYVRIEGVSDEGAYGLGVSEVP
jgi:Bacterial pre-peptidase C-terminal domain